MSFFSQVTNKVKNQTISIEQGDIKIFVDTRTEQKYESASVFLIFINKFFILPLLTMLPFGFGTQAFTMSSVSGGQIYKYARTSRALELLYLFNGRFHFENKFFGGFFTYYWQHSILNAKAVRNRIKLVKNLLENEIKKNYTRAQRPIKILSLASGSARAVLEVISNLEKQGVLFEVRLLDLSPDALNLSNNLATALNIKSEIKFCNDKVSNFMKYCNKWQPDIIEMVGFLDYLSYEKALSVFFNIHEVLADGGVFITCNIRDNFERKFIEKVVKWTMIYREPEDLARLLADSGFLARQCEIVYEPMLIHGLAIGRK